MAKKPFRTRPLRQEYIQVRLDKDERKRIEELARSKGQTLSAYLRERALGAS